MLTMPRSFQNQYKEPLKRLIQSALKEDIGDADHSALACLSSAKKHRAQLLVKEDCVIAGVEMASMVFKEFDPSLTMMTIISDGTKVEKESIVFEVEGSSQSLLATERLVLNCLQRMSGIASLTKDLAQLIGHTSCQLLDTRKTTPNFRHAEKWAVQIGGGVNHRMGLYDAIMIKDNHIDYNGSLETTLEKVQIYLDALEHRLPVIVETRSLKEVTTCLKYPWINRLLLDNMNPEKLKEALLINAGQFPTEASGNISRESIVAIAETGVDYVSLGALTHSAQNIDLSLKAKS